MIRMIGALAIIWIAAAACEAPEEETAAGIPEQAAATERIEMTVEGLACALCARALESQLAEIEGSQAFEIDVDKGEVAFGLNDGHGLNGERLRDLVEAAGFRLEEVHRAPWLDDPA